MHFVIHACVSFATHGGCEERTTGAKSQSRDLIFVRILRELSGIVGFEPIIVSRLRERDRPGDRERGTCALYRSPPEIQVLLSPVLAIARNRPSSEDDRRSPRFDRSAMMITRLTSGRLKRILTGNGILESVYVRRTYVVVSSLRAYV